MSAGRLATGGGRIGRLAAAGGILGPLTFTAAWAALGATREGYDSVREAISQLAAVGTTTRGPMTAALVAFGVGVPAYGLALGASRDARAGAAAIVAGAATIGVALLPLEPGRSEVPHTVMATVAYAASAAIPLFGAGAAGRRFGRQWAVAARAGGVAAGLLLAGSTFLPGAGLLQRAGLALTHVFVVATAVDLVVRPDPDPTAARRSGR